MLDSSQETIDHVKNFVKLGCLVLSIFIVLTTCKKKGPKGAKKDAKPADAKPGAAAGAKPEEMKTAKKEEATDKKDEAPKEVNPTQETSQKDAPKEPKEGDTKKEETTDKKTADATQTQSTAQTMKTQGAASAKGDEAKKTQKSGADDDKKDSDKK
ncbi:hypothetical protein Q1695_002005 [Nippostrongylus brasiliensis]|nr:hypothetical protein Q1695_002005 [Nippostrongylus brasiliensis]